jgi:hypothetical protein
MIHLWFTTFVECMVSRITGKPQFVIKATLPDGQTGWTAGKAGNVIALVSRENATVYRSGYTAAVALSKMSRPPCQFIRAGVEQVRWSPAARGPDLPISDWPTFWAKWALFWAKPFSPVAAWPVQSIGEGKENLCYAFSASKPIAPAWKVPIMPIVNAETLTAAAITATLLGLAFGGMDLAIAAYTKRGVRFGLVALAMMGANLGATVWLAFLTDHWCRLSDLTAAAAPYPSAVPHSTEEAHVISEGYAWVAQRAADYAVRGKAILFAKP